MLIGVIWHLWYPNTPVPPFLGEPFKLSVLIVLLIWVLRDIDTRYTEKLSKIDEKVKGDPLTTVIQSLDDAHPDHLVRKKVAESLFKQTEQTAAKLLKPQDMYKGHYSYIKLGLIPHLLKLTEQVEGGRVYAVCGPKNWEDPYFKEWLDESVAAIDKKVSVTRIFLEPKSGLHYNKQKETMDKDMGDQAKKGIRVWYAPRSAYESIEFLRNMPDGFGFVVFVKNETEAKVIVHFDPSKNESALFSDSLITNQFRHIVKKLRSQSIPQGQSLSNHNLKKLKKVEDEAAKIINSIQFLKNHRISNLQLNYVHWRLHAEIEKLEEVISKENITILARPNYDYLSEVLCGIINTLGEGDTFQVITKPEIWNGLGLSTDKLLKSCNKAISERKATIKRFVLIDSDRLVDSEYLETLSKCVDIFKSHRGSHEPVFIYVSYRDKKYIDILKECPLAFVSEAKGNFPLRIRAINFENTKNDRTSEEYFPKLLLKFDENKDAQDFAIRKNFDAIISDIGNRRSTLDEM